jgi:transcriptional regulator with XRE-family HTH domain
MAKDKEANHLRAWRERARLSQEQLAEAVGTTGAVISLLESGDRGLSAKWLRRLAPVLGTTPGFLLDYQPDDIDPAFLDVAREIPADQKDQALRVLRSFRKAG